MRVLIILESRFASLIYLKSEEKSGEFHSLLLSSPVAKEKLGELVWSGDTFLVEPAPLALNSLSETLHVRPASLQAGEVGDCTLPTASCGSPSTGSTNHASAQHTTSPEGEKALALFNILRRYTAPEPLFFSFHLFLSARTDS